MISSHPRYTSDVSTDPDKIQWTQKRTWLNWSSSIILELYSSITSGWTSWKDDDLLYMTPSVLIGSIFNRRVLVPRNDPARFYSMHHDKDTLEAHRYRCKYFPDDPNKMYEATCNWIATGSKDEDAMGLSMGGRYYKRRLNGVEEGDLEDMGRETEDGVELESHSDVLAASLYLRMRSRIKGVGGKKNKENISDEKVARKKWRCGETFPQSLEKMKDGGLEKVVSWNGVEGVGIA
ncbi:hypothetical protein BD769DRAFT_1637876 [Suillus cothurnatus]|nr:hypothetical protein BD769DRAFT_1637876 [Suillus cothurnatus]